MAGAQEWRRYNLRRAVGRSRQNDFARLLGVSASFLSCVLNGVKPIGERLARKVEARLQLAPGALDLPPRRRGLPEFLTPSRAPAPRDLDVITFASPLPYPVRRFGQPPKPSRSRRRALARARNLRAPG